MINDYDSRIVLTLLKKSAPIVTKKKETKPKLPGYPDYGKSIVSRTRNPTVAGIKRGLSVSALSAVLTALATRIAVGKNRPGMVAAGAGIGGIAGFVPGYISGSEEAKSDYTRLLFLRRLGLRSLGEYGTAQEIPEAARLSLSTKVRI